MYVDLRSSVSRGIFIKGEFDPNVFGPIRTVLRPGDTFLDIGANVGYYSMLALDMVGSSGRVHAFEIDERPLRCLRKTKTTQKLDNFLINAVAIGDQTGKVKFHQDKDDCGNSHLASDGKGREVQMITLDEWFARTKPSKVRAIKMDIEGAEILALRGAQRFIEEHRPLWVCEAWDSNSEKIGEVGSFLQGLGYQIEILKNVHSPIVVARP